MRDVTLTDVELIGAFGDADRTFLMLVFLAATACLLLAPLALYLALSDE